MSKHKETDNYHYRESRPQRYSTAAPTFARRPLPILTNERIAIIGAASFAPTIKMSPEKRRRFSAKGP